tara:strand:- start:1148 stop:1507 length:360 start_codon:yes stop_codon:yes gene_type:complete
MTNDWSHLPNARHIDRIIAHSTNNPDIWFVHWDHRRALFGETAMRGKFAEHYNAFAAIRGHLTGPGRYPARNAVAALIVYDDSAKYLEYTPEELEIWAALSEDPAAILLLPAVIAMNAK